MADIFISYSSKDRARAEQLIELLASAGLSVWIDKSGIDVATSWSSEIVDAINGCKAFVVLLSPNSMESVNVIKEVSLASEKRKKIVPLDLEPVALTRDFEYQLAGLQRAPMTNIDSVIRVLAKLGLEATQPPSIKLVKETDGRKSLMILPFEDLSPTGDNAWFADGIANELIAALSRLKQLRVADQQATKDYKRYQGNLPNYAKEMAIRYFIQGDVRKFGDQIKITATLLDIETGDHLWQDSMKGVMNDIFDIQETVAEKVVEGLKVHLASEERKKLVELGTENAEAYELYLKGQEYFDRQTGEGFQLAAKLWSEAIALDSAFAEAYSCKAAALAALYRSFTREPRLLEEGLTLVTDARRMRPRMWSAFAPLTMILLHQGNLKAAEAAAQEFVLKAPEHYLSHFSLGCFYQNTGQAAEAIAPFEESLKRRPGYFSVLFNLVLACADAGREEKEKYWSEIAIPIYEKRLKLFPGEEKTRVDHAALLFWVGRDGEARAAARKLEDLRDGKALFNTACLQAMLKDYPAGILMFRKAIEAGFRATQNLNSFLHDAEGGIGTLNGTPEWEDVRELVEALETTSIG